MEPCRASADSALAFVKLRILGRCKSGAFNVAPSKAYRSNYLVCTRTCARPEGSNPPSPFTYEDGARIPLSNNQSNNITPRNTDRRACAPQFSTPQTQSMSGETKTNSTRVTRSWRGFLKVFGSHEWPRRFIADRLDNIPRFIEHLDFRATVAGALPCIAQR